MSDASASAPASAHKTITAAVLVIGDEILSGRTKDQNIGYIAEYLTRIGIELREVRVVPDVEREIVEAVNALRTRYDYLFTTGGIGPTHDDITAECVAKAVGVGIDVDERAVNLLLTRMKREDLNEMRLRMCRIPAGASLIENPVSAAPGFRIANVIVMAGVPRIMHAMLDNVAPTLETGVKIISETLEIGFPEGLYAAGLKEIAERCPDLSIGSYPSFGAQGYRNQVVLRGKDPALLAAGKAEVEALIAHLAAQQGAR
jgi:molybdenum cofactor synthesis domain-containing protein